MPTRVSVYAVRTHLTRSALFATRCRPVARRVAWSIVALAAIFAGVLPAPPVAQAAGGVRIYEQVMTLRAYDWQAALVPTTEDDAVYPYPRLDHDKVGPLQDITTTVVILESSGIRLTIAPEFGGRILRWHDKRQDREMLYVNPVIKPTRWGFRGWWFGAGGIEWAFPTNEHGLNEWSPWRYSIWTGPGFASVTVADREKRTGLDVSVTIVLYSDDRVSFRPKIVNRTGQPHKFQFWINSMIPYSEDLRFNLPAQQVEIHSTGDATLPKGGETMPWPASGERDFSRPSEWHQYLGVFAAPALSGRASVDNTTTGVSVRRAFPYRVARGVKLFLLGDLPASLYTDDDSRYVEMWGGYTRTFDEDATIQPGQIIGWHEWWSIR